ncbi:hypothetical protein CHINAEXTREME_02550 [Halobiforma lacisalsi AJ5]|uniref:DUF8027 domain-containing protein n=1 Tax=Natronobacterium lacisalsi AJ5 TaxID=358396 RepID=M0LEL7_NATLA|nr:hypothetical protein [Halobiforma lacisalsi]APW96722.1 hypothetical protein CHINAEXTREME_02550 [Halobiforma lacisalsi AJ5]EMA31991.1 hypothetical protein C445_11791 [Halobiforma lacisalsi AJ5]
MPIPGYDPEDIEDALETNLEEAHLEEYLSESERETYRNGDAELVDLLEADELRAIVEDEDVPVEETD